MKTVIFAVSLAVLVFGVSVLAQTQTESVEQELIKLEKEWAEAEFKQDIASIEKLSRMWADEFIMTLNGSIITKAQCIEFLKTRKTEILSSVLDEWKVRVYGDAAVVMGRSTYKMRSAGKEETVQNRFTDTWIIRDGRWQCVAAHTSTIAQK